MQTSRSNSQKFGWNFDHSYTKLPPEFFVRQLPTKVKQPRLVLFNQRLANTLGLDSEALLNSDGEAIFGGNQIAEGADPIAQAYAGHQFGHFNMLGDGRAILLGEHITPLNERYDIQLKGAGITPYSRRGDGRAALGPMLREYIISEAMAALGIPSTLSLAVVSTGEPVYREHVLPGAILTRVASSHIRVGTFQFASARLGADGVKAIADYSIHRHYPECASADNPYLLFLNTVIDKQASLIAKWMSIGFIHGVMNTDNMSIAGETIDYGPCAFMDSYHQATVFSSIDQLGRYAFGNQPHMAQWNLARFAETLLSALSPKPNLAIQMAEEALHGFLINVKRYWLSLMIKKIGLLSEQAGDLTLVEDLLLIMENEQLDYTNTFRQISHGIEQASSISKSQEFLSWHQRWKIRLNHQPEPLQSAIALMHASNPKIIPRNHQVELALQAAETGDFSLTERLIQVTSHPFSSEAIEETYLSPAPLSDPPYKTFCGT